MPPEKHCKLHNHSTPWLLSALAALLIIACKDDSNNQPQSTACQNPVQLTSFPLSIGHQWLYYRHVEIFDTNGILSDSLSYLIDWTIASDTVINGVTCFKFAQSDSNFTSGITSTGATYCYNTTDGFYGAAVENGGSSLNFRSNSLSNIALTEFSGELRIDTVFIPSSPLQFLKFPSQLNDTWTEFTYPTTPPASRQRTYEACESVTIQSGIYDCLKIREDFISNGAIDTSYHRILFYSHKGIIKEELRTIATENTGNNIGEITIYSELINVNF